MMAWYNWKTNDYDYRDAPQTDEEAKQYIRQDIASQGLYDLRREMGDDVLHAILYVLEAHVRSMVDRITPPAA